MVEDSYLLSFTGANLSLRKSLSLAKADTEHGSWEAVEDRLLSENILQMRTNSAAVCVHREIVSHSLGSFVFFHASGFEWYPHRSPNP